MTPLILLAKQATNWTDIQLADLLGISKSSVTAIRKGRMRESLDTAQRQALAAEVAVFLSEGAETLAEIELRS